MASVEVKASQGAARGGASALSSFEGEKAKVFEKCGLQDCGGAAKSDAAMTFLTLLSTNTIHDALAGCSDYFKQHGFAVLLRESGPDPFKQELKKFVKPAHVKTLKELRLEALTTSKLRRLEHLRAADLALCGFERETEGGELSKELQKLWDDQPPLKCAEELLKALENAGMRGARMESLTASIKDTACRTVVSVLSRLWPLHLKECPCNRQAFDQQHPTEKRVQSLLCFLLWDACFSAALEDKFATGGKALTNLAIQCDGDSEIPINSVVSGLGPHINSCHSDFVVTAYIGTKRIVLNCGEVERIGDQKDLCKQVWLQGQMQLRARIYNQWFGSLHISGSIVRPVLTCVKGPDSGGLFVIHYFIGGPFEAREKLAQLISLSIAFFQRTIQAALVLEASGAATDDVVETYHADAAGFMGQMTTPMQKAKSSSQRDSLWDIVDPEMYVQLKHRYRKLIELLDSSERSIVFLFRDDEQKTERVVKVMKRNTDPRATVMPPELFYRLIPAIGEVACPLLGYHNTSTCDAFVMERGEPVGPGDLDLMWDFCTTKLLPSLQRTGVHHCDLKPSNFIKLNQGGRAEIRVIDLEMCIVGDTRSVARNGTEGFKPPVEECPRWNFAGDVYGVLMTLTALLQERFGSSKPFSAFFKWLSTERALWHDRLSRVYTLYRDALDKNPSLDVLGDGRPVTLVDQSRLAGPLSGEDQASPKRNLAETSAAFKEERVAPDNSNPDDIVDGDAGGRAADIVDGDNDGNVGDEWTQDETERLRHAVTVLGTLSLGDEDLDRLRIHPEEPTATDELFMAFFDFWKRERSDEAYASALQRVVSAYQRVFKGGPNDVPTIMKNWSSVLRLNYHMQVCGHCQIESRGCRVLQCTDCQAVDRADAYCSSQVVGLAWPESMQAKPVPRTLKLDRAGQAGSWRVSMMLSYNPVGSQEESADDAAGIAYVVCVPEPPRQQRASRKAGKTVSAVPAASEVAADAPASSEPKKRRSRAKPEDQEQPRRRTRSASQAQHDRHSTSSTPGTPVVTVTTDAPTTAAGAVTAEAAPTVLRKRTRSHPPRGAGVKRPAASTLPPSGDSSQEQPVMLPTAGPSPVTVRRGSRQARPAAGTKASLY